RRFTRFSTSLIFSQAVGFSSLFFKLLVDEIWKSFMTQT
ncbi:unnamed protein product, partial [Brassica oleracea var. botrytis]